MYQRQPKTLEHTRSTYLAYGIEIRDLTVEQEYLHYLSTSRPSISIHERMVALQLSRGDMRPLGMNSLMDLVIVDVR